MGNADPSLNRCLQAAPAGPFGTQNTLLGRGAGPTGQLCPGHRAYCPWRLSRHCRSHGYPPSFSYPVSLMEAEGSTPAKSMAYTIGSPTLSLNTPAPSTLWGWNLAPSQFWAVQAQREMQNPGPQSGGFPGWGLRALALSHDDEEDGSQESRAGGRSQLRKGRTPDVPGAQLEMF